MVEDIQNDAQNGDNVLQLLGGRPQLPKSMHVVELPAESVPAPVQRRRNLLFWYAIAAVILFIALLAVIIVLGVLLAKEKGKDKGVKETPHPDPVAVPVAVPALNVNTFRPSDAIPILGSGLGVAEIILGTYFSNSPAVKPQIKAIYDGGNGKMCIRTKLGDVWLDDIRCVEGANPKSLTPLTICDWIGGPSAGFVNADGHLSSINYVPKNDTWVLSSLAAEMVTPHEKSKLASVSWRNGTALWFNYQDHEGNLREHGIDDYRNVGNNSWRDSSGAELIKTQIGSSYGIGRYTIGEAQYEEIFFQSSNGAIQGMRYTNSVWDKNVFSVEGTESGVPLGRSFTATTFSNGNGSSTIVLAYITTSGFLKIQTRSTNVTDLKAFTKPQQVVQAGGSDTVLAADGSAGVPRIYYLRNQKISLLEFTLDMRNWTTTEITSP